MARYYSSRRAGHKAGDVGYGDFYSRKMQEAEDAGMIREDINACANLPQEVIYKSYPAANMMAPADLDDTMIGIDRQQSKDVSETRKGLAPRKI